MVPFTHTIKKIKDAAHKKGDVDGTCKRAFRLRHALLLSSFVSGNEPYLNRVKANTMSLYKRVLNNSNGYPTPLQLFKD